MGAGGIRSLAEQIMLKFPSTRQELLNQTAAAPNQAAPATTVVPWTEIGASPERGIDADTLRGNGTQSPARTAQSVRPAAAGRVEIVTGGSRQPPPSSATDQGSLDALALARGVIGA